MKKYIPYAVACIVVVILLVIAIQRPQIVMQTPGEYSLVQPVRTISTSRVMIDQGSFTVTNVNANYYINAIPLHSGATDYDLAPSTATIVTIAARATRLSGTIVNLSTPVAYVTYVNYGALGGATNAMRANGYMLSQNTITDDVKFEIPRGYTGALYIVGGNEITHDLAQDVRVVETWE